MRKGYSFTQIALHWAVLLLLIPQFFLHDAIAHAWREVMRGGTPDADPLIAQHVVVGILLLALVLWRILLRVTRGAPEQPAEEPPLLRFAARAAHGLLYLLLLLIPVSGLAAWFGGVETAAFVHETMFNLLVLIVILHVGGALYHQFVLKTNLLDRMRKPERP